MKSVLGAGRIKGKHVSLTLAIGISRGRSGVELSEFSEISGGGEAPGRGRGSGASTSPERTAAEKFATRSISFVCVSYGYRH